MLLLDEQRGIAVTGLLGILLVAKQHGYLATVRPVLHDLRTQAGFWIAPALFIQILEAAGEA